MYRDVKMRKSKYVTKCVRVCVYIEYTIYIYIYVCVCFYICCMRLNRYLCNMKIMYLFAGNLRCNFSTYLFIFLQNRVRVPCALLPLPESMQAFRTCTVLPVSHILPRKVLMEQTNRNEISKQN